MFIYCNCDDDDDNHHHDSNELASSLCQYEKDLTGLADLSASWLEACPPQ
jgi:hypothetical protein